MAKIERYFSRATPSTAQPMARVDLGAENISRGSASIARGVASIAGVLASEGKRIGDSARTSWLISETTARDTENKRILQEAAKTTVTKESDIDNLITSYKARAEATRNEISKNAYDQKGAGQFTNADVQAVGQMEGLLRATYLDNLSRHSAALTAQTEAGFVTNGNIDALMASREATIEADPSLFSDRYVANTNTLMHSAIVNNINDSVISNRFGEAYAISDNQYFTAEETESTRQSIKGQIENAAQIDTATIMADSGIAPEDKPNEVSAIYDSIIATSYKNENGEAVGIYNKEEKKRLAVMQHEAISFAARDVPFQLLEAGRSGEAMQYVDFLKESNYVTAEDAGVMKRKLNVEQAIRERKLTIAERQRFENQSQEVLTADGDITANYNSVFETPLSTQQYEYASSRERHNNYKAYFDMLFSGQLSFTDLNNAAFDYGDGKLGLAHDDAQKLAGMLQNWNVLDGGLKDEMMGRVDEQYEIIGSSIMAMLSNLGYDEKRINEYRTTLDQATDETKMTLFDWAVNTPNVNRIDLANKLEELLPVYMSSDMVYKKMFGDGLKSELVEQRLVPTTFGSIPSAPMQREGYVDIKSALESNLRRISGSAEDIVGTLNYTAALAGYRNIEPVMVGDKQEYQIAGEDKTYKTMDKAQAAWLKREHSDEELQRLEAEFIDEKVQARIEAYLNNPSEYLKIDSAINYLTPRE